MEHPEPNPHAKPYKDRATRRAARRAARPLELDRVRTGQPLHIKQAAFDARRALIAEVQRLGIPTAGRSMKQIRLAVSRAQLADDALESWAAEVGI